MAESVFEFGDLVLLIGDFHIPMRSPMLPPSFQELLNTNKIRHILCTGNIGCDEVLTKLKELSSSLDIVKGDMDFDYQFPDYKIVQIGNFKIGLLHGHQILPWGDAKSLTEWQRRLDCDILVYSNGHQNSVSEVYGKYFINPGSVTGAFHPYNTDVVPSFMLMAIKGSDVSLYVYEEHDGKANVNMIEFSKKGSPDASK